METRISEGPNVRIVLVWGALVICALVALGMRGCVDPEALRVHTRTVATEIERLPGVTSTSVSTLGAFSTGGGISVEFDGAISEAEFLKSCQAAVAMVKGGSRLHMTDVEYGNIDFEPSNFSFDPAPLLAMKRIPGFSGASFSGRDYVSFDTPLAAVNAVESIRDQNLVRE